MNENNNINSEAVATLPPKKSMRTALIIGVVVALLIAGAVAVFLKFFAKPDPQKTIEAAFTATAEHQQVLIDELYKEIPAAKVLFEGRSGALTTDFDYKFKAIENNPYGAFVNAILQDAGIKGQFASDPEKRTASVATSVYLQGTPVIDATAFVSPEHVVLNTPTFSQTALSFNPATFAQDYTNSALNAFAPMDTQTLDLMQSTIVGSIDAINFNSTASNKKFLADLKPIFAKMFNNATYTYDEQSKKYVVDIPGADVKNVSLEFLRYCYLESDMAKANQSMFSSSMGMDADISYEETMNQLISEIEKTLLEMDAKLTLDIQKDLIKSANLVAVPASETANGSKLVFDWTSDNAVETAKTVFTIGDQVSMTMDVSATHADGTYAMDLAMEATADTFTCKMPIKFSIAADGAFNCVADVNIAETDSTEVVDAGFAFNGTAVYENDTLTMNLPNSRIYASSSDTDLGALVFDTHYTNAPLTEALTAPESTALFELDAQQLEELSSEYYIGYENFIGQMYSLLMG
ncbi:MAG: hypothetical protein ACK5L0_04285 [Candidatus Fimivivens sp.]